MKYVNPIRATLISFVCLLALLFASPNFLPSEKVDNLPGFMPHNQLKLGLDLQGGSYLRMKVETQVLSEDLLKNARSDIRSILREEKVLHRTQFRGDGTLLIALSDIEQKNQARKLLASSYRGWDIEETDQGFAIKPSPSMVESRASEAVAQSIEVIRRRVDPQGVSEPSIQREGSDRIILQMPGVDDPEQLKQRLGQTARLEFRLAHPAAPVVYEDAPVAAGYFVAPSADEDGDGKPDRYYQVEEKLVMAGENLVSTSAAFNTNSPPYYMIQFKLDTKGGVAFSRATQPDNKGRALAILLDGEVISAPEINDPITGGSGVITGQFDFEEAENLSILLNAGALPVPLTIIEEQTIGPGLGQDAIDAGKLAFIVGVALVIVFMVVVYLRFGAFATFALFVNILVIVALLSMLRATLTLPGIAGIVLTIGMAVDANVIIFERIREELRSGITPFKAVNAGYGNAMSTILDANITTLIAALILYQLGTGPIKGFAVTLTFGVLGSMFTAIYLTRLLINIWLSIKDPVQMNISIKMLDITPNIGFLNLRKIAPAISFIFLIFAVALLPTKGLNYGLDFTGGTQLIVSTPADVNISDLRAKASQSSISGITITSYGHKGQYMVQIPAQMGDDGVQEAAAKEVREQLSSDGIVIEGTSTIGGAVSEELKQNGLIAVTLAMLAMMVYIIIRFEWQFGLAAVIALLHDIVLTLGMFSLIGMSFSLTTVAAILTIAGYSINDTVVVFDRVRENMRRYKKMPMIELLNTTLNQTLSRTIMTSLTTLLALVALYFSGAEVLKNFSFAMIWGVLVGTWSSLFIAVPALLWFKLKQKDEKEQQKEANPYGDL